MKERTLFHCFSACLLKGGNRTMGQWDNGFSLIELIVVIAMLSVLFLSLFTVFNPVTQYNKAKDAQRQHDLEQVKQALDSYFNDTGCYPTSLLFGTPWKTQTAVYMEEIPQDPDVANGSGAPYVYQTDGSDCPQWNVLYASLKGPSDNKNTCPLTALNSCLPQDFTSGGYQYCTISGNVNCSTIAASTIVTSQSSGGSGSGGSGGSSNPTPTSPPIVCASGNYYGCTGDNRCNSIYPAGNCTQNGGSAAFCYCDLHCNQSCRYN